MMRQALKRLSYVLFPRRCALCGEVVAFDEERCSECMQAHHIQHACRKCGSEKDYCRCKEEGYRPRYTAITAPYYFRGSVRSAIYRLKSSGFKELVPAMAADMAACVRDSFSNVVFDCVCFVPMTRRRRKKRGYNQSELLARAVAAELGLACRQIVIKTKDTKSQRLSTEKERKANLNGAFAVAQGEDVRGKTVLLIDDVKTTGSTLNECASAMKARGAGAVYAVTLAVTAKEERMSNATHGFTTEENAL